MPEAAAPNVRRFPPFARSCPTRAAAPGASALALVALAFASLATLVVPYAIREMVDQRIPRRRRGSSMSISGC